MHISGNKKYLKSWVDSLIFLSDLDKWIFLTSVLCLTGPCGNPLVSVLPWASCQINKIAGCARTRNVISTTAGKQSRHASRHVRDACTVMPGSLTVSFEVGGVENVPAIPGACANRNFAYLIRAPWAFWILFFILYKKHVYSEYIVWNWYGKSPWIKSISNDLDITIHVIASQLFGHCDVISNRSTKRELSEWYTGAMCKDRCYIVISAFVMSCKK